MKQLLKSKLDPIYSYLESEFYSHKMPIIDLIAVAEDNPYKILVATILSARTKDETTADASERLFSVAPDLITLDALSVEELEKLIFPVGFYKNKAKYLSQLPNAIFRKFDGEIPETIDELCELPGVGRKTANLVSAIAFRKDAICVDTHVHRITNRLGFLNTETPLETEMTLRNILPREYWIKTNAFFVSFGQNRCRPISPKCDECQITEYCGYYRSSKRT